MKRSEIKKEICCKKDGKDVFIFTFTNANGSKVELSNYGGLIIALFVPDKNGALDNVVLGLDSLGSYLTESYVKSNPYFGVLVGRYANRIRNAKFTIDSVTYTLIINCDQKHHIHGGTVGFDKIVWDADTIMTEDGPELKLTHLNPDGHEGFPGNLKVTVIYTLTNDDALRIDYFAETDKPTIANFTNHSYFNLAGEGNGNIFSHQIMIKAEKFTPVDNESIPTGEIKSVAGTPYDFRKPFAIGEKINQIPRGYDMNYVLDHPLNELGLAARVYEPTSGRVMEVFTTEPGMQLFTANGFDGTYTGKSGKKYEKNFGLCLETEHFPDSPNKPNFPSTVLRPGEKLHSTTIYKFSAKKD